MKPLQLAWKKSSRQYRIGATHVGSAGILVAWQDHLVVPYYAGSGADDIAAIHDRRGEVVQTIPAPPPSTITRSPIGPVITWPDETLVAGVGSDRFDVMWIEPGGASHVVATDIGFVIHQPPSLTPSSNGDVFVTVATRVVSSEGLGWTLDPRLDSLYGQIRHAPFEDHEQASTCIGRAGVKWTAPGRVSAVADDVAICEEGSGTNRCIVGRRISDAGELWRREAVDTFVLGSIPMPAWSDDRVYVVDRGDRRRQSWAREIETANIHGISADQPMQTFLSIRAAARMRTEQPIIAPSVLRCLSTKTGDALWEAPLDGDVVSFYCHATWVGVVVAGESGFLCLWRHDGASVSRATVTALETSRGSWWWPPDGARWPSIVHGTDEHVLVAQNRVKGHGARLYEVAIEHPALATWEIPLQVPAVHMPLFRSLRLLNRVPLAVTKDAVFLRWGKQLYGFLPNT